MRLALAFDLAASANPIRSFSTPQLAAADYPTATFLHLPALPTVAALDGSTGRAQAPGTLLQLAAAPLSELVAAPLAAPAALPPTAAGEVAFQTTGVSLDLNADNAIRPQDAQILYYVALGSLSTAERDALLDALRGTIAADQLLANANAWLAQTGQALAAADLNQDGALDVRDAQILYYAYQLGAALRASPALRDAVLSDLAEPGEANQDGYLAILERAAAMRPPVVAGDLAFTLGQDASYILTPDDLTATDPDGASALIWTVTTGPLHGRLALSGLPATAINTFTQAQLAAGEVLYVHTGADTTDDSFAVRVADPDGGQAEPVTLDITITTPTDRAPTGVTLTPTVDELPEDIDTSARTKVADIAVTDADDGPRNLELTGADAALFALSTDQTELFLIADAELDFETNPSLDVTVRVALNPAVSDTLRLPITDGNDAPTTTGNRAFTLDEGASYTLTVIDLSASDENTGDGAAQLIWTVTGVPMNGRLELRPSSGAAMTIGDGGAFTQADLEAGRVVYVHDDSNTVQDSFTVRVADDENAQAEPVMLSVNIERILDSIDLTELAAADGFIIQGDMAGDLAGSSVSSAGDVNGDGYADLIVGAIYGDDGGDFASEAYVVFGKADGFGSRVETTDTGGMGTGVFRQVIDLTSLAATDGFIIQGDADNDRAGYSVSSTGDVNGDGYADLIVGAPSGGDGGSSAGEAYVVFGKADGFGSRVETTDADGMGTGVFRQVIDLTGLTVTDGFIIQGDAASDQAGRSVSGAGDVNGDGYADLIVGASFGDDGGPGAGEAYVVFGRADGFGSLDTDTNRQVIDLTGLAATDGFIIQGDATGDSAGQRVSIAGDVNGDGYADLIVGATAGDDGGSGAGEAYVVFGKADGFGSLDTDTNRRVIDLTGLAATDGFIIQGDAASDRTSTSVSGAGDVNGDGFTDLIVGAPSGDDGGSNTGEAYVVFGKADGFGSRVETTDTDGMGTGVFRQVIDLTGLAATDGFIIQGDTAADFAGRGVSGAGDVNGDGYADLLVGAYAGDDGGSTAGEAYVIFGRAGGFGSRVETTDTGGMGTGVFRQVIDLTGLAAADGFIIQGDAEDNRLGRSVSSAGDVNGDGYADLLVGAPRGDDGGNNAGEAYVIFGGPAGLTTEAAAVLGAAGDDTLNQDGQATVVLAGAGDDVLRIDGFGSSDLLQFDGGSGTDTLRLSGSGLTLDLTTLANPRLTSIERIDLNSGGNSLVLSRLDLLTLTEVRASGQTEVRVEGGGTDSVSISEAGWTRQTDEDRDGTTYAVFQNGEATTGIVRLLVNDAVNTNEIMLTSSLRVAEQRRHDAAESTDAAAPPHAELDERVQLDAGSLRLDGGGLALDLAALTATPELAHIDLTGGNRIQLSRDDLLSLAKTRADGKAELRIDGGEADSIHTLDRGWKPQEDERLDGVTYAVFENGAARLLVNLAVNAEGVRVSLSLQDVLQGRPLSRKVGIDEVLAMGPELKANVMRQDERDEIGEFLSAPLPKQPAFMAPVTEPMPAGGAADDADLFDLPGYIPDDFAGG